MFRPIEKKRHVVLTIKTTNLHTYNPEEGDRLTEIACVEMINGELTGNNFNSFIKVEDAGLLEQHYQNVQEKGPAKKPKPFLSKKDADELRKNIANAPLFKDVQKQLFDYLNSDPNTKIIVHYKKYVLDFLRQAVDAEGRQALDKFTRPLGIEEGDKEALEKAKKEKVKDRMENMISKAAKLSHAGTYAGGRYPNQIDTGKEKVATTRSFYKFNDVCEEMGVNTRLRTDFSAVQDADMLARAERFRLHELKPKLAAAKADSSAETKQDAKNEQPRRTARK